MASILSAGTTSATAMVHTADTSGVLQLAVNNGTVSVTLDTSGNILNGVTTIGSANPGMYIQNNQATSTGYNIINTNASGQAVFFAGSAFNGGTYCSFGWNGSSVASGSYVYNNPNVTFLAGGGNNNLQIGTSGTGSIKFYNGATQSATINSSGYMLTPYQPAFWVVPNGSYAFSAGTVMSWGTARYNQSNSFNTSTGVFTAPVNGVYQFCLTVGYIPNNSTNSIACYIRRNGSSYLGNEANNQPNNQWSSVYANGILSLNAGDTVDVVMNGTAIANIDSGLWTYFSGYLVG